MESIEEIIKDSIDKISKGLSNKVDAYLLSDLKRMSELGVLEIHTSQPDFKPYDEATRTMQATQNVRLYFKGEDTIKSLQSQLKAKDEEIEWLKKGEKVLSKNVIEEREENIKLKEEIKELQEKQRQFIIDAYNEGDKKCMNELGSSIKGVDIGTKSAEQYYNETFKK
jgi:hypothetical protein